MIEKQTVYVSRIGTAEVFWNTVTNFLEVKNNDYFTGGLRVESMENLICLRDNLTAVIDELLKEGL